MKTRLWTSETRAAVGYSGITFITSNTEDSVIIIMEDDRVARPLYNYLKSCYSIFKDAANYRTFQISLEDYNNIAEFISIIHLEEASYANL